MKRSAPIILAAAIRMESDFRLSTELIRAAWAEASEK